MEGTRTLVLGGGFGGAAAALTARRLMGERHLVTLVDRSRVSRLCGANPSLAVGARGEVVRSLEALEAEGIEVLEAEVTGIDVSAHQVTVADGVLDYDHLVVALGAAYDWSALPGAGEAHSFYEYERTLALRRRLEGLEAGTVLVGVAGTPYKCPPAPIEMALLMDWAFRRRGIRHRIALRVAIPEPAPLAVAGTEASDRVRRTLAEREVQLDTGTTLAEVSDGGSRAGFSDGSSVDADVVVAVPRHRLPAVVEAAGLAGDRPWVPVDPATLETAFPGVFAVGDVNAIPIGDHRALPKAGVFAAGQGRTVGALIASRVGEAEPPPPYDGTGHCFLSFSGEESAPVGGTFLGSGGPEVGLGEPSREGMGDRLRFEEAWTAFRS